MKAKIKASLGAVLFVAPTLMGLGVVASLHAPWAYKGMSGFIIALFLSTWGFLLMTDKETK